MYNGDLNRVDSAPVKKRRRRGRYRAREQLGRGSRGGVSQARVGGVEIGACINSEERRTYLPAPARLTHATHPSDVLGKYL